MVSSGSASASEALLIGLMPYMDIELIGENTHGKYCGGYMLEADEWYEGVVETYAELAKKYPTEYSDFDTTFPEFSGWKNYVADWGIYVMISTYSDKNGNNPCRPNGLAPSIEVADEPRESYPLGDEREALLRAALTKAGKTDLAPLTGTSSRSVVRDFPKARLSHSSTVLDGKRILVKPDKGQTPRMLPMK